MEYDKHPGYRLLKKEIEKRYGKETAEKIWLLATDKKNCLVNKYNDISDAEKLHVHDNILPRVAMYYVLKEEVPDNAMELLNWVIKENGMKIGKLFDKISQLPGMASGFIKIFKWFEEEKFGEKAGFERKILEFNKNEFRFDILKCPYHKYCEMCGCPELTKTFCDSDTYCYGNLKKIEFQRNGTIGTGADKCDFYLKKR